MYLKYPEVWKKALNVVFILLAPCQNISPPADEWNRITQYSKYTPVRMWTVYTA